MTNRAQYAPSPADADLFCQTWSGHVDALERHLSIHRWAVTATTVAMIAYPIARVAIPAVIHGVVPDVVRVVLRWI